MKTPEVLIIAAEAPVIPVAVAAALVFTYTSMVLYWPIDNSPQEVAKMWGIPFSQIGGMLASATLALSVGKDMASRINSLNVVPAKGQEAVRR